MSPAAMSGVDGSAAMKFVQTASIEQLSTKLGSVLDQVDVMCVTGCGSGPLFAAADILCLQLLPVDLTLDKPSALALARSIEPHLDTHVPQSPAGSPSAVVATCAPRDDAPCQTLTCADKTRLQVSSSRHQRPQSCILSCSSCKRSTRMQQKA